jgi:hypothetical protein
LELADANRSLIVLVHIADTICCQDARGFNLTALHQALDLGVYSGIAMDEGVIARVRASTTDQIAAASALG